VLIARIIGSADGTGNRALRCIGPWYKPRVLEFRLLGPLEVRDGEREIQVPRQKQRALLAALLLRAGQVVSKDRLVADVWGDDAPRMATAALQNTLSQLRRILGDGLLVTRAPGYMLEVDPDQVDFLRFERLVEEARRAPASERADLLRRALELFRGQPLADLVFEPFAQTAIARLEERAAAVREELIDAELELGRHADVVPELESLIAVHPYREHLRVQLMLALYRSGRQAEALATYVDFRRLLVDELGIEPGHELQELERMILRHDVTLRLPEQGEHAATAAPTLRPSRKTVTVLVSDLVSGADATPRDPESVSTGLDSAAALARLAVERHGGTVARLAEGMLTALFGVPVIHEDDAVRAVRAALELRETLAAHRLAPRTALSTGEVFVSDQPGALATGDVVGSASRLAREAAPGDILLGPETFRLVESGVVADAITRPGGADAGSAWFRVDEVLPEAGRRGLRLDSPLVGRERQVDALTNALALAVEDKTCHLLTLIAPPGAGKSRLARDFVAGLGSSVTVLQARCMPYGEGITFSPLLELARQAVADHGVDPARAESLVSDESLDATFAAARKLLEQLASERTTVVVLDDLQWAEPAILDLVEHVAERSRVAPLLLLCSARPELLDLRPAWGGGKPNAGSILLEPLTAGQCEQLVDNLLGASDLPAAVRSHIVGAAEGNPLFVEELLAVLVDRDVLRQDQGRWTTRELPVLSIPPTIQALIASRVDRLPDAERTVLEPAAVEGRVFGRTTLESLVPDEVRRELDRLLASLVRRELVRVAADEEVLSFRHGLIRDVVYESVPKRRRAELHERLAELRGHAEAVASGAAEILGFHLERAYLYRRELGEDDDRTCRLAADAATHLAVAAEQARARGDAKAAARLHARAAELRSG
jgi:DNA-binding SARP family transcriptional activator